MHTWNHFMDLNKYLDFRDYVVIQFRNKTSQLQTFIYGDGISAVKGKIIGAYVSFYRQLSGSFCPLLVYTI